MKHFKLWSSHNEGEEKRPSTRRASLDLHPSHIHMGFTSGAGEKMRYLVQQVSSFRQSLPAAPATGTGFRRGSVMSAGQVFDPHFMARRCASQVVNLGDFAFQSAHVQQDYTSTNTSESAMSESSSLQRVSSEKRHPLSSNEQPGLPRNLSWLKRRSMGAVPESAGGSTESDHIHPQALSTLSSVPSSAPAARNTSLSSESKLTDEPLGHVSISGKAFSYNPESGSDDVLEAMPQNLLVNESKKEGDDSIGSQAHNFTINPGSAFTPQEAPTCNDSSMVMIQEAVAGSSLTRSPSSELLIQLKTELEALKREHASRLASLQTEDPLAYIGSNTIRHFSPQPAQPPLALNGYSLQSLNMVTTENDLLSVNNQLPSYMVTTENDLLSVNNQLPSYMGPPLRSIYSTRSTSLPISPTTRTPELKVQDNSVDTFTVQAVVATNMDLQGGTGDLEMSSSAEGDSKRQISNFIIASSNSPSKSPADAYSSKNDSSRSIHTSLKPGLGPQTLSSSSAVCSNDEPAGTFLDSGPSSMEVPPTERSSSSQHRRQASGLQSDGKQSSRVSAVPANGSAKRVATLLESDVTSDGVTSSRAMLLDAGMRMAARLGSQGSVDDSDRASSSTQQSESADFVSSSISLCRLPRGAQPPPPIAPPASPNSSCTLSSSELYPCALHSRMASLTPDQNNEDVMSIFAPSLDEARRRVMEQKSGDNPAPRRSISLGLLRSGSIGGEEANRDSNKGGSYGEFQEDSPYGQQDMVVSFPMLSDAGESAGGFAQPSRESKDYVVSEPVNAVRPPSMGRSRDHGEDSGSFEWLSKGYSSHDPSGHPGGKPPVLPRLPQLAENRVSSLQDAEGRKNGESSVEWLNQGYSSNPGGSGVVVEGDDEWLQELQYIPTEADHRRHEAGSPPHDDAMASLRDQQVPTRHQDQLMAHSSSLGMTSAVRGGGGNKGPQSEACKPPDGSSNRMQEQEVSKQQSPTSPSFTKILKATSRASMDFLRSSVGMSPPRNNVGGPATNSQQGPIQNASSALHVSHFNGSHESQMPTRASMRNKLPGASNEMGAGTGSGVGFLRALRRSSLDHRPLGIQPSFDAGYNSWDVDSASVPEVPEPSYDMGMLPLLQPPSMHSMRGMNSSVGQPSFTLNSGPSLETSATTPKARSCRSPSQKWRSPFQREHDIAESVPELIASAAFTQALPSRITTNDEAKTIAHYNQSTYRNEGTHSDKLPSQQGNNAEEAKTPVFSTNNSASAWLASSALFKTSRGLSKEAVLQHSGAEGQHVSNTLCYDGSDLPPKSYFSTLRAEIRPPVVGASFTTNQASIASDRLQVVNQASESSDLTAGQDVQKANPVRFGTKGAEGHVWPQDHIVLSSKHESGVDMTGLESKDLEGRAEKCETHDQGEDNASGSEEEDSSVMGTKDSDNIFPPTPRSITHRLAATSLKSMDFLRRAVLIRSNSPKSLKGNPREQLSNLGVSSSGSPLRPAQDESPTSATSARSSPQSRSLHQVEGSSRSMVARFSRILSGGIVSGSSAEDTPDQQRKPGVTGRAKSSFDMRATGKIVRDHPPGSEDELEGLVQPLQEPDHDEGMLFPVQPPSSIAYDLRAFQQSALPSNLHSPQGTSRASSESLIGLFPAESGPDMTEKPSDPTSSFTTTATTAKSANDLPTSGSEPESGVTAKSANDLPTSGSEPESGVTAKSANDLPTSGSEPESGVTAKSANDLPTSGSEPESGVTEAGGSIHATILDNPIQNTVSTLTVGFEPIPSPNQSFRGDRKGHASQEASLHKLTSQLLMEESSEDRVTASSFEVNPAHNPLPRISEDASLSSSSEVNPVPDIPSNAAPSLNTDMTQDSSAVRLTGVDLTGNTMYSDFQLAELAQSLSRHTSRSTSKSNMGSPAPVSRAGSSGITATSGSSQLRKGKSLSGLSQASQAQKPVLRDISGEICPIEEPSFKLTQEAVMQSSNSVARVSYDSSLIRLGSGSLHSSFTRELIHSHSGCSSVSSRSAPGDNAAASELMLPQGTHNVPPEAVWRLTGAMQGSQPHQEPGTLKEGRITAVATAKPVPDIVSMLLDKLNALPPGLKDQLMDQLSAQLLPLAPPSSSAPVSPPPPISAGLIDLESLPPSKKHFESIIATASSLSRDSLKTDTQNASTDMDTGIPACDGARAKPTTVMTPTRSGALTSKGKPKRNVSFAIDIAGPATKRGEDGKLVNACNDGKLVNACTDGKLVNACNDGKLVNACTDASPAPPFGSIHDPATSPQNSAIQEDSSVSSQLQQQQQQAVTVASPASAVHRTLRGHAVIPQSSSSAAAAAAAAAAAEVLEETVSLGQNDKVPPSVPVMKGFRSHSSRSHQGQGPWIGASTALDARSNVSYLAAADGNNQAVDTVVGDSMTVAQDKIMAQNISTTQPDWASAHHHPRLVTSQSLQRASPTQLTLLKLKQELTLLKLQKELSDLQHKAKARQQEHTITPVPLHQIEDAPPPTVTSGDLVDNTGHFKSEQTLIGDQEVTSDLSEPCLNATTEKELASPHEAGHEGTSITESQSTTMSMVPLLQTEANAVQETALPHHAVEGTALPHHAVEGTALPHHAVEGTALPHHAVKGTALPHHAVEGTALPHHAVEGTALPHHAVKGTALPHHAVTKTALPHNAVEGTTLPHHAVEYLKLPRHAVEGTTSPNAVDGTTLPHHAVEGTTSPNAVDGTTLPHHAVEGTTYPNAVEPYHDLDEDYLLCSSGGTSSNQLQESSRRAENTYVINKTSVGFTDVDSLINVSTVEGLEDAFLLPIPASEIFQQKVAIINAAIHHEMLLQPQQPHAESEEIRGITIGSGQFQAESEEMEMAVGSELTVGCQKMLIQEDASNAKDINKEREAATDNLDMRQAETSNISTLARAHTAADADAALAGVQAAAAAAAAAVPHVSDQSEAASAAALAIDETEATATAAQASDAADATAASALAEEETVAAAAVTTLPDVQAAAAAAAAAQASDTADASAASALAEEETVAAAAVTTLPDVQAAAAAAAAAQASDTADASAASALAEEETVAAAAVTTLPDVQAEASAAAAALVKEQAETAAAVTLPRVEEEDVVAAALAGQKPDAADSVLALKQGDAEGAVAIVNHQKSEILIFDGWAMSQPVDQLTLEGGAMSQPVDQLTLDGWAMSQPVEHLALEGGAMSQPVDQLTLDGWAMSQPVEHLALEGGAMSQLVEQLALNNSTDPEFYESGSGSMLSLGNSNACLPSPSANLMPASTLDTLLPALSSVRTGATPNLQHRVDQGVVTTMDQGSEGGPAAWPVNIGGHRVMPTVSGLQGLAATAAPSLDTGIITGVESELVAQTDVASEEELRAWPNAKEELASSPNVQDEIGTGSSMKEEIDARPGVQEEIDARPGINSIIPSEEVNNRYEAYVLEVPRPDYGICSTPVPGTPRTWQQQADDSFRRGSSPSLTGSAIIHASNPDGQPVTLEALVHAAWPPGSPLSPSSPLSAACAAGWVPLTGSANIEAISPDGDRVFLPAVVVVDARAIARTVNTSRPDSSPATTASSSGSKLTTPSTGDGRSEVLPVTEVLRLAVAGNVGGFNRLPNGSKTEEPSLKWDVGSFIKHQSGIRGSPGRAHLVSHALDDIDDE
ncbi:hypothetical protein CEUSTIGMA_g507.t1 [Chlamydomonas eustigma]|uniref:Uncharacterized protein n=1 Tax=Chlamydomonas eustigma TaxID=1157962 RepID=A0A250WQC4_9CHLO|nr:hypothetical protein CEUSTIGMA_g507.t1 [Chlamydomonas eustigma]|eukprot:GAX73054.1 hypothetical protein CEUSTIGMA_g507.t1 [Chlamydomonas eustigma]